jgi:predicted dehydrogenase
MQNDSPDRRGFLKTAGAALTTSLFTGAIKGANDKINIAFIGIGQMGRSNLGFALKHPDLEVVALCDVYQPNLDYGASKAKSGTRQIKDFREILADKSIDAVCISAPDHWHAYMTVEACKAGKDVYVEKPISVTIEEGSQMVEAAGKYKRVVQAGTMQRSSEHFQKATELIKSGALGKVVMVHSWNYSNDNRAGIGDPPDSAAPSSLDWDMWQGPAPARPYNANRFGFDIDHPDRPRWYSNFRYFWDYAGGMMTDWGVHWLDIVQMAFNEEQPRFASASGGKYFLTDNRETPDTLKVTYEYPSGWIATYENRNSNAQSMMKKGGGILFYGEFGTMFVDRSEFFVVPEMKPRKLGQPAAPEPAMTDITMKSISSGNVNHWANFVSCVKTREKPNSDIGICFKSTATCLLGNVALRSGQRVEWDTANQNIKDPSLQKWMAWRETRSPWKISV